MPPMQSAMIGWKLKFSIDDVKNAFFADDPIISDENSDYGSYSFYVALGLSGAYLQMEYNSTTRQTIFYKTPWYDPKVHLLVQDYPADIDSFNKNNIDREKIWRLQQSKKQKIP